MNLDKKIIGLDFLRFSMAILMVLYHTQPNLDNKFLKILEFNGFYATSVFFILSGFILTHVYNNKIKANNFSQSTFLIRRFSALYPVHIFTLVIALGTMIGLVILKIQNIPLEVPKQILSPISPPPEIFLFDITDIFQYLIQSLLLVHAWDYRLLLLNGASWSVSALFFFYIFFGYFAKSIIRTKKIFLWFSITWFIYITPPLYFTLSENFTIIAYGLIHRNPLLRLPEFILGIIFYKIATENILVIHKYRLSLFTLGILGFICVGCLVNNSKQSWFYLTHNGLFIPAQMALISSFLFIKIKSDKIMNIIERLGKSSLTIYMLHLPLLAIMSMFYKLIYGILNSNNLSEAIVLGKNLEYLGLDFLFIFLLVLIPLSLFLQERLFTPLQHRLSDSIIEFKNKKSSNEINS